LSDERHTVVKRASHDCETIKKNKCFNDNG
jgi:hypothetical protein